MYAPFSLSTLRTTTTSFRPTRMSFWIDRIRLRESSDRRIMPSVLSYSSYLEEHDEQVRPSRGPEPWSKQEERGRVHTSFT